VSEVSTTIDNVTGHAQLQTIHRRANDMLTKLERLFPYRKYVLTFLARHVDCPTAHTTVTKEVDLIPAAEALRLIYEQLGGAPVAPAVPLLAHDHRGIQYAAGGILLPNHAQTADGDGLAYLRGEMLNLLNEMAERYYAGDISAVDEFLQLFAIRPDLRENLKKKGSTDATT
jgi:hypothetical protein